MFNIVEKPKILYTIKLKRYIVEKLIKSASFIIIISAPITVNGHQPVGILYSVESGILV